jgi:hypothetical protein
VTRLGLVLALQHAFSSLDSNFVLKVSLQVIILSDTSENVQELTKLKATLKPDLDKSCVELAKKRDKLADSCLKFGGSTDGPHLKIFFIQSTQY